MRNQLWNKLWSEIVPIRLDLLNDWLYNWSCDYQLNDITIFADHNITPSFKDKVFQLCNQSTFNLEKSLSVLSNI